MAAKMPHRSAKSVAFVFVFFFINWIHSFDPLLIIANS